MSRRRGFTLIELLVVIAIIAILAAMLFPVFARARESARKIQCLSNVKNVGMAMQMYLTDFDRFPPGEHDADVIAYWQEQGCDPGCCSNQANPYLRWPVILDEYTKNRDIWRCPSAKHPCYPAQIMPVPDWFTQYKNGSYCACADLWPVGWGGAVTDTNGDNSWCRTPGEDAVEFGIGMSEALLDVKTSTIDDPAKYLVAFDSINEPMWGQIEQIAFPDICRIQWGRDPTCSPDWENDCGDPSCSLDDDMVSKFWTDATLRSKYARHLGGSNLGFADGHAAWWAADAIIAGAGNRHNQNPQLQGIQCQCLPEGM